MIDWERTHRRMSLLTIGDLMPYVPHVTPVYVTDGVHEIYEGPSRDVPQEVRDLEMAYVTAGSGTRGLVIMTALG